MLNPACLAPADPSVDVDSAPKHRAGGSKSDFGHEVHVFGQQPSDSAKEPALRSRSESPLQPVCEPSERSVVPRTG
jgi:hypothetical protein